MPGGPVPVPVPVLGPAAGLPGIVRQHGIRRVIVTSAADGDAAVATALRQARELGADICVVPRLPELGSAVPRSVLDEIWGVPLLPLRRTVAGARLVKRAFDISVSLPLLVLLAPLIALFAAVTRWQLRRPALFRQMRVTGSGRQAEIFKLRTLDDPGNPDTCWTVPLQRCTAFGRFLRSTHLDELPQLANVALGQMSLVGPRPERPYFALCFEQDIPGYASRQRMTAGLTGWAQVHGLNGDTSIRERARFDNAYIENWSIWLDLVVVARTVTGLLAGALPRHVTGRPGAPPGPAESTGQPPSVAARLTPGRPLMKVLHVITGLNVGGAELQLRSILQHTRHDADVITLYNPGPVADMIRADGTLVRDLGMTRNTEVSALARLCRLIRDGGYDVVHSHLYRSQIYARPAAWLAGMPVVLSTEHSIGEIHLERRRMTRGVRALYLATERLSAGTIAVSPTVRDRLVSWGVSPRRVTVIPNGVDLRRVAFDPAARERVRAEHGIGSGHVSSGSWGWTPTSASTSSSRQRRRC